MKVSLIWSLSILLVFIATTNGFTLESCNDYCLVNKETCDKGWWPIHRNCKETYTSCTVKCELEHKKPSILSKTATAAIEWGIKNGVSYVLGGLFGV